MLDIAVGVFKLLFSVVQRVFPGIKSVITSVWNFIKPLVEGIGKVMSGIASGWNWLAGKVSGKSGGGYGGGSYGSGAGRNASGTNNWRGGPTWVGENGPELISLPKGTKILPNKESVALASRRTAAPLPSPLPQASGDSKSTSSTGAWHIVLQIAKLADAIIVREDADIDKIGETVSREVIQALKNMPKPA